MTDILTSLILLSAFIYLILAFLSWQRRSNPGAGVNTALMLAFFIYSIGYWFEIQSPDWSRLINWVRFEYLGISTIPSLWILFCLQYTGRQRYITRGLIAVMVAIPLATLIIMYTNNYHNLYYSSLTISKETGLSIVSLDKGPWYWVHMAYINLCELGGNTLLFMLWLHAARPYRRQASVMFMGSLVPWVCFLIYLFGYSPANIDICPFGLVFTGLAYTWGLYRYRLFDLVPIPRTTLFENMVDGVLLLDEQNRVVDMNEAASSVFGMAKNMIGQPASVFFRDWPGLASLILGDGMAAETRFDISDGIRWFDIQVSHLLKEELGGRLVMVRDATDRKRQEARLDALNEELVRRNQDLKQYNTEIAQLNQLISGLQTCTGQKEAYAITAEQLGKLFPRVAGSLYIYGDDQDLLELKCSWNVDRSMHILTPGQVERLSRRCFNSDLAGSQAEGHSHSEKLDGCDYLFHPLISGDEPMGLLHFWARFGELDSNRLQLIRILADSISLAFSNLKMKEDLQHQSIRDPLTQLFNRRYMEETLQRELARSERMGSPLAVIMGDIDHFKSFNDKYGHLVGDQILQQVSAVMESNIRNGDVACRYGGEEFILILPGAPLESALQRAEFLRTEIKRTPFAADGDTRVIITVSFGVAVYPQHGLDGDSLLLAVDQAMYRAKQAGRDCVRVAENDGRRLPSNLNSSPAIKLSAGEHV